MARESKRTNKVSRGSETEKMVGEAQFSKQLFWLNGPKGGKGEGEQVQ